MPRERLGQGHVDHLELEPVRAKEVDRVVATRTERELSGSFENLTPELTDPLVNRVHLLVALHVERHVMQARRIPPEALPRQLRLGLAHIERRAVPLVRRTLRVDPMICPLLRATVRARHGARSDAYSAADLEAATSDAAAVALLRALDRARFARRAPRGDRAGRPDRCSA